MNYGSYYIYSLSVQAQSGGSTPLYKLYRYVSPHQVGFLRRFSLKTGRYTLCPFWSVITYGFWGNYGIVWTCNSKWVREKNMPLRNEFEELFCLRSNLGNDNIISAWRPGLKTGMDFRGLVWKRVRKITFLGLKSGQDLEKRAAHRQPRIPRSTPWGDLTF